MDRILGRDYLVVLYQLSQVVADKREEPLSQVRVCVNGHIAIAIARSYSRMICRARLPSHLQEWELGWDKESGIGMAV